MSENINGLMNDTLSHIKDFIDVNSVIGNPITTPDGTTIIPVVKVNIGFATGGADMPSSSAKEKFGGGGGGGITVTPIAFLIVKDGNVRMLQTSKTVTAADKAVDLVPEVMDKVSGFMNKDKASEKEKAPEKGKTPPKK
ncbi:MAG: GerW family sporulation protein [Oscillospiraceae bacterium]